MALNIDMRHEKIDLKGFWYDRMVGQPGTPTPLPSRHLPSAIKSEPYLIYLQKSVSYQKKDERCHACPSFFWYDND